MKFYSPSTKGFYDKEIHGSGIPSDAIEITNQEHQELIDGQSSGKVIEVNGTKLVLVDYIPTQEDILRKARQDIADRLATLTVKTSNGNVFDATLEARQNMADAILASDTLKELVDKGLLPADTVWDRRAWRIADNTEPIITIGELKEAHALAIQEYARIKGIGV